MMAAHKELVLVLLLLLLLLAALVYIVYLRRGIRRSGKVHQQLSTELQKLENRVASAELEQLRNKINPHLFKNILNSIQSHAYQTYSSLDKLSSVLDYILYETENRFVSVKEEVAFAENLIAIHRLKLSPLFDLRVKTKISDTHPLYTQELVVPMLTVDLIENAFKHADLQSEEAFIAITFELKDDDFSLTVANKTSPLAPLKKQHSGLGRQTLRKRLELAYKDCYRLEQVEEAGTFVSHLTLNLLDYKAKLLDSRR